VIAGFRGGVNESFALLGCSQSRLRNIPEERRSHNHSLSFLLEIARLNVTRMCVNNTQNFVEYLLFNHFVINVGSFTV
jgi:hypothetical protein